MFYQNVSISTYTGKYLEHIGVYLFHQTGNRFICLYSIYLLCEQRAYSYVTFQRNYVSILYYYSMVSNFNIACRIFPLLFVVITLHYFNCYELLDQL